MQISWKTVNFDSKKIISSGQRYGIKNCDLTHSSLLVAVTVLLIQWYLYLQENNLLLAIGVQNIIRNLTCWVVGNWRLLMKVQKPSKRDKVNFYILPKSVVYLRKLIVKMLEIVNFFMELQMQKAVSITFVLWQLHFIIVKNDLAFCNLALVYELS